MAVTWRWRVYLKRKGASAYRAVGSVETPDIPIKGSPYQLDLHGTVIATEVYRANATSADLGPGEGQLFLAEK